jgi:hypothetical protein
MDMIMRKTMSQTGPFLKRASTQRPDKTPLVDRALNLLFRKKKEKKPNKPPSKW